MPWRELSVDEERLRFVILASRGGRHFSELCQEFGISRQTGYCWLKRYQSGGSAEMVEHSRKPLNSPGQTSTAIEQEVVQLRQERPDWGAPKIHNTIQKARPELRIAIRTVHRILQRHGLTRPAERRRVSYRCFEREAPNQLWQMDFKGPAESYRRCGVGPLSLLDDHSRYVLALEQLGSTQMQGVRATLQHTFQQCGVPESMLMDHGTPWWNAQSPWGWSELTVWLMRQGIRLLFSGLRHPQTQGKVERMHGALQQAVRYRGADLLEQRWLDIFRHEYNHIRPHAALGMATPASRWRPSTRRFQLSPAEWEYPSEMEVVRLAGEGQLWWRGQRWEVSRALRGQRVGIQLAGDRALVYFCRTSLRELDLATGASHILRHDVHG